MSENAPAEPRKSPLRKLFFAAFRLLVYIVVAIVVFDLLTTANIIGTLFVGGQRGQRELVRRMVCESNVKYLTGLVGKLDAAGEYDGETLGDLIAAGKIDDDPRLARCPNDRDGDISYRIDPEGLRCLDRPLIIEKTGLHPRMARRVPAGHTEGFRRSSGVEVVFVLDRED